MTLAQFTGFLFPLIVHEEGHALRLAGADPLRTVADLATENIFDVDLPYIVSHSNIRLSVMNYDSRVVGPRGEPDCFPHPMDVLAIHALYQTGYGR